MRSAPRQELDQFRSELAKAAVNDADECERLNSLSLRLAVWHLVNKAHPMSCDARCSECQSFPSMSRN